MSCTEAGIAIPMYFEKFVETRFAKEIKELEKRASASVRGKMPRFLKNYKPNLGGGGKMKVWVEIRPTIYLTWGVNRGGKGLDNKANPNLK